MGMVLAGRNGSALIMLSLWLLGISVNSWQLCIHDIMGWINGVACGDVIFTSNESDGAGEWVEANNCLLLLWNGINLDLAQAIAYIYIVLGYFWNVILYEMAFKINYPLQYSK